MAQVQKAEPVKFGERMPERVLEIQPDGVIVNDAGQIFRHVLVRLPKGMISDDLRDPKIWKRAQQRRQTALIKFDHLLLLAFDESWTTRAVVTHATDSEVHLAFEKQAAFPIL